MNGLSENDKGKQPLEETSEWVRILQGSADVTTNRALEKLISATGMADAVTSVQQRRTRFCEAKPSEIKDVCNPSCAASNDKENNAPSVSTVKRGICQIPNLDLSLLPPLSPMGSFPYQYRGGPAFSPQQYCPFPTSPNPNVSKFRSPTPGVEQPPRTQLTIFYAGKVHVYKVSADKAKDIMGVASRISGSSGSETPSSTFSSVPPTPLKCTPHRLDMSPITPSPSPVAMVGQSNSAQPKSAVTALPITKRISIQRFLEKRKGRLLAGKVPYARPEQN